MRPHMLEEERLLYAASGTMPARHGRGSEAHCRIPVRNHTGGFLAERARSQSSDRCWAEADYPVRRPHAAACFSGIRTALRASDWSKVRSDEFRLRDTSKLRAPQKYSSKSRLNWNMFSSAPLRAALAWFGGRMVCYSFPARLSHSLLHAGLSRLSKSGIMSHVAADT